MNNISYKCIRNMNYLLSRTGEFLKFNFGREIINNHDNNNNNIKEIKSLKHIRRY